MTPDAAHELQRLRATAYGRTRNADDEQAAADARLRLQELAAATPTDADADADAAAVTEPDASAPETAEQPWPAEEPTTTPPKRRLWPRIAIAAGMVACFGLGFAVASVAQQHPGAPEDLGAVAAPPPVTDSLRPQLNPAEQAAADERLASALALLDRPWTSNDLTITPELAESMSVIPESVRLVDATVNGNAYAVRNTDGDICLLATDGSAGWALSCIPESEFGPNGGLAMGMNSVDVSWDGQQLVSAER
ncbi:hypothetical protein FB562_0013 [Homoserinimonas aerilata]|uniref:Uncharacterized protein n=1 Tax=Homoserinimonas aerilata TaxID=1162970 RepID=A0A542YFW1_9MICO|nr:hypothetical protein [Homoserinimonas aerilata]TQL46972.1 hypothetical protein FB562_0013 [Homoserinimonas aerilata]